MDFPASARKKNAPLNILKLILVSLLIGALSTLLAIVLKRATEYYETILLNETSHFPWLLLVLPLVGLTMIYWLRQYLFRKKENKGIREIFESTQTKSKNLPCYKIPSHFINGFLTVVFGGSTGIEVSTVVASATIGSMAQQQTLFRRYKTELIAAGVAAGITALFCSPIAGILFSVEVIARKTTRTFFATTLASILMACGLLVVLKERPMFELHITTWHHYAIPYMILLGILAALHSIYLTKTVLYGKLLLAKIDVHYYRILIGSAVLSLALLLVPALYGDGYHALRDILLSSGPIAIDLKNIVLLVGILLLKPVVTAITLSSGGDGGVFAPSLLMGAFLGWTTATILNTYLGAGVIPLNFAIIGMAAVLSASIHAPLTALFLVCGMIDDYTLLLPILGVSLLSKYTAQLIYPFTVYTYRPKAA